MASEVQRLVQQLKDVRRELSDMRIERDRLRARIDAVREIYAGMEGFIPQTAPEAYLLRITKQMYDAALGGEGKDG